MTFYGVTENSPKNGVIGAGVGAGYMVASKVVPTGALALPFVPFATVGTWLVIVGLAGPAEELFFRCLLLSLFVTIFKAETGIRFFFVALLQAILFSLYHIVSYAGIIAAEAILSVSGSFFSAAIFGLTAAYLTKKWGLVAAIVAHMVINAILLYAGYFIVG